MTEKELKDVFREVIEELDLSGDKLLVVRFPGNMSLAALEQLSNDLTLIVGKHKFLLLEKGLSFDMLDDTDLLLTKKLIDTIVEERKAN